MRSKLLESNGASRISDQVRVTERKLGVKERLFDEVIKFLAIR